MQTACHCRVPVNYTPPINHNPVAQNSQNNTDFSNEQSLTGDEQTDELMTSLILLVVQLLLKQFGQQQQSNQQSTSNPPTELSFDNTDKQHLLTALEPQPAAGTQVGRVQDIDASNNLNQGDNVELLNNNSLENRSVTDADVGRFIDLRTPFGTPRLTLTDQQLQQVESAFNIEGVSIADNNGDGVISTGDIIRGTQGAVTDRLRLSIPVTDTIAGQLA